MLDEAVELLVTNVTTGFATPEAYTWLARLYRAQGHTQLSYQMLMLARELEVRRAPPLFAPAPSLAGRRILSWGVGLTVFVVLVIGIEALDEKPGQLNPLRSVWYLFALASGVPAWQLTLELALSALAAWVIGSLLLLTLPVRLVPSSFEWTPSAVMGR